MKIIKKIAVAGLGLLFTGSSVFAQSLADAKKAIGAEQYQKAKSMLKNLTVTEPTKDENYFYLGWVYLKQDYPDSAKAFFQKGLNINPKSALNYAGLGTVARLDKDQSTASSDFSQAIALAGKDSKPYVYIAKGYLLPDQNGKVTPAEATAALDVLNKGAVASAEKSKKDKHAEPAPTDPELFMTRGEANRLLLKSNDAYTDFSTAQTLDPQSPATYVALGVLWKYADNFDGAEEQFKQALSKDPNYGPAYREWAETDYRWAHTVPAKASEKIKEAVEHYKKYLSLTDNSVESQMRYADFLINAGDYQTLQQVATDLTKAAGTNLRVYRYLMYAAAENKDYPAGLQAGNTWMTKADPKRLIPRDYLYYGRIQIASGQDSVGIATLRKALTLDSSATDVYGEIANTLWSKRKYGQAGDAYAVFIEKGGRQVTLNDYLKEGISYYFSVNPNKPDTTVLNKADSALSYIQHKATTPPPIVILYRARVNDLKDGDRNNIKGLAKPYYEQFITAMSAKATPSDDEKRGLIDAYDYLGSYYEFKEKDQAKAAENYTKAKELDPTNKQAAEYFKRKGGAKSK
ncbi:tetratricopeptide repeat protein [Mucilaginibacter ginsenosidivorans]|uniref:Tetratricopeptide repeat protein n=1 Tax=Mucilaginibacter ginsenosidivorans TaxID=398053 RepID=A0A5B8UQ22_9SPHI|nr:tetratricopeptide repeat protein [Mucilaginibacter ginsenosidivorans]QEC61180.1 tetratricopeptide repeat protein [Mucilaginibacter ginsenosidivorans]